MDILEEYTILHTGKAGLLNSKNNDNRFGVKVPKIALIGNPNCGKTTLFNHLTGDTQCIGNWPGVTVERKEGRLKGFEVPIRIVDLPGIYSLSPYSPEEIITRNYITDEKPDLIINIIDSTNLERSLYLTIQLMELGCRMVLALNMADILEKKGKVIDLKELGKEIGLPVVSISAGKGAGIDSLVQIAYKALNAHFLPKTNLGIYSQDVEAVLSYIEKEIIKNSTNKNKSYITRSRFNAIKFFENDHIIMAQLNLNKDVKTYLTSLVESIKLPINIDREILIADQRYRYICDLYSKCVSINKTPSKYADFTRKIDNIVTDRFLAIPIFLSLILCVFFITFGPLGNFLKFKSEWFINVGVGSVAQSILNNLNAAEWSKSLVLDAVIRGVGSVVSFLPQVLILFTLLSLLEDSGYMSRAVFIIDRLLRKFGLSGKAFVPLIMGFGCSVPAVLGTRILDDKKSRNLTIFLIPFMSCSAKMPLYLLFASCFFRYHQAIVVISLYLLGILLAVFSAYIFKDSLFKGPSSPFVMELPEYKIPSLKNLRLHIWDRAKDFIERAGTVVLGATIVIWFLQSFDRKIHYIGSGCPGSILSSMGSVIAPIFSICGFGNWKAAVSLITGIIAKESIVSTMSVLYPHAEENLSDALSRSFSNLEAFSFMVFVLLYNPCIAAISAMHKELKSTRLTIISMIYQFGVALFMSAFVYQTGMLINNLFIR